MFKLFKTPHTRTNQTRKNTTRPSDVVCCDQTYAKSKQGIFKLVMLLGSFLAWMCCATTPYVKVKILKFYHFLQFSATFSQFFWFFFNFSYYLKKIYPIGGVTWPFHMVMFFTVTANLALIIVYAIFTSGYHRRRKRKPWPTYEVVNL